MTLTWVTSFKLYKTFEETEVQRDKLLIQLGDISSKCQSWNSNLWLLIFESQALNHYAFWILWWLMTLKNFVMIITQIHLTYDLLCLLTMFHLNIWIHIDWQYCLCMKVKLQQMLQMYYLLFHLHFKIVNSASWHITILDFSHCLT